MAKAPGTPNITVGGFYNAGSITLQDGQAVPLQFDANGNLMTTGGGGSGGNVTIAAPVDANGNVQMNPVDSGGTTMTNTSTHSMNVSVVSSTGVAKASTASGQTL